MMEAARYMHKKSVVCILPLVCSLHLTLVGIWPRSAGGSPQYPFHTDP